ncbi:hypothetical protein TRVL_09571 [Trypanosoma vivax]|nr:hypothetical protein TRVL_09571 [Trypanosoma vivax]
MSALDFLVALTLLGATRCTRGDTAGEGKGIVGDTAKEQCKLAGLLFLASARAAEIGAFAAQCAGAWCDGGEADTALRDRALEVRGNSSAYVYRARADKRHKRGRMTSDEQKALEALTRLEDWAEKSKALLALANEVQATAHLGASKLAETLLFFAAHKGTSNDACISESSAHTGIMSADALVGCHDTDTQNKRKKLDLKTVAGGAQRLKEALRAQLGTALEASVDLLSGSTGGTAKCILTSGGGRRW